MQRPDETKRQEIMRVAATMFAERPFHEVRLDEIAAATRLGKGTIYVYFASKEDLYTTLIAEGIDRLVQRIAATEAKGGAAWPTLERVVRELLGFAEQFPHLYSLMRGAMPPQEGRLSHKRGELVAALAGLLRRGRQSGEFDDPHPAMTAEFVLSGVRAAILFPPPRLGRRAVANHLLRVLGRGIREESHR